LLPIPNFSHAASSHRKNIQQIVTKTRNKLPQKHSTDCRKNTQQILQIGEKQVIEKTLVC
jgi:hypothetical protein